MELKLVPNAKNQFPTGGILIKNTSPTAWVLEIQRMGFSLAEIKVYAIPNTTANSVWGCFIAFAKKVDITQIGKNEICLQVAENLFITEKSILQPTLTKLDIEKLFASSKYLFHPAFGLVDLGMPINLVELLRLPQEKSVFIRKPLPAFFAPSEIRSFQINPVSPEEVLQNMEEQFFPQKEPVTEAPLSIFEKGKLAFYKLLLSKGKANENGIASYKNIQESEGFLAKIAAKLQQFFDKDNKFGEKMMRDLADLERRNQKQVNNLMELFQTNPEEALKYAIPLDSEGSGRGGNMSELTLSKNWDSLSWLGGIIGSGTSGGGALMPQDTYMTLHQQYTETARQLIQKGDYQKAAFVYMKLLKNPFLAAQSLEDGKYYQEAATVYLKHAQNKAKAADCYEKGNMLHNAIELHKELNNNEKVGDLYLNIGKRKDANLYFEKVVDDYKMNFQYLKASLIYKNKMKNPEGSQSLLLEGWRKKSDSFNCINNYFNNIEDLKILKGAINEIYDNDVNDTNREVFLQAIRHEYQKNNELSEDLKEIAYELIAEEAKTNATVVLELRKFNNKDSKLLKDAMRYKATYKKR